MDGASRTAIVVHDVVIIGSGAGGGTVTKVLADLGVKVLLMEAGPMVSMGDFKMLQPPSSVWHRGAGEMAQLYTTGQGAPLNFNASFAANTRRRAVCGGAGQQLPLVPLARHRRPHQPLLARPAALRRLRLQDPIDYDGVGWNWPISYQDIAPYYDKAERLIGVTGKAEGIRSAPDGIFQTPAALKPREILVQQRLREARDPGHQRAPGGASRRRTTAGRRATTAASAGAAARRRPTTRRATCRSSRR